MHEAYEINHLLKLNVQIESIAAYGNIFKKTLTLIFASIHFRFFR